MDARFTQFRPQKVDASYVNTLVDFVNACKKNNVQIREVNFYNNGWLVTFQNVEGDAICHDGSYGSPCYGAILSEDLHGNNWNDCGRWETLGFPWDHGDFSVHTSEELAKMIGEYQRGEYIEEE